MVQVKQFIHQIISLFLSSFKEGGISSKRLTSFFAFSLIVIYFFCNLIGQITISDSLLDVLMYIVLGTATLTAGENITSKMKKPKPEENG